MSRAILTRRTARKRRRCEFCGLDINPGEPYVAAALPPGTDIGNRIWLHSASHGETGDDCEAYWLVDNAYDRPLEMA